MANARIPIATSIDPESSDPAMEPQVEFGAQSVNVIYDRYPDNRTYATQRPSLNITTDPNDFAVDEIGRGVYFWEAINSFIMVNNDQVGRGYGDIIGTILPGREPVYFVETPDYLVLLDPQGNKGYTIEEADPTSIVEITSEGFPPNQTPTRFLAGGGAYLDGFVFVLDTQGFIWNSAINDPLTWTALDFLDTGREADTGLFLARHHDNIVALSSRSVEFFFNAGIPVGSPLSRRQDVTYRTGPLDKKTVGIRGDVLTFMGTAPNGTVGLYELSRFQLAKRSSFSLDRAFANLTDVTGYQLIVQSFQLSDHTFVFITPVAPDNTTGGWVAQQPYVFDLSTQMWTTFSTVLTDIPSIAPISVTDAISGADRSVSVMLTDGKLLTLSADFNPIDGNIAGNYWADPDYMEDNDDYIEPTGSEEFANIEMSITLPEFDFGTDLFKYMHSLWVVGTTVVNPTGTDFIELSWTDDHYSTFNTPRLIATDTIRRLTRLGKFRRRAFRIEYSGEDVLRIEALELNAGVSSYA